MSDFCDDTNLCAICTGLGDAVAYAAAVEPMVVAAVTGEATLETGAVDDEAASNVEVSFVNVALTVVGGIVFVTSSVESLLFVAAVSCKQKLA